MKIRKTNPVVKDLIEDLRRRSYSEGVKIWKDLSKRLAKSTRQRTKVNVGEIGVHTKEKEQVAVPGKVLGFGELDHPVVVAALGFSLRAREKIVQAGGECIGLSELVERNPKGSKVRIIA